MEKIFPMRKIKKYRRVLKNERSIIAYRRKGILWMHKNISTLFFFKIRVDTLNDLKFGGYVPLEFYLSSSLKGQDFKAVFQILGHPCMAVHIVYQSQAQFLIVF